MMSPFSTFLFYSDFLFYQIINEKYDKCFGKLAVNLFLNSKVQYTSIPLFDYDVDLFLK